METLGYFECSSVQPVKCTFPCPCGYNLAITILNTLVGVTKLLHKLTAQIKNKIVHTGTPDLGSWWADELIK